MLSATAATELGEYVLTGTYIWAPEGQPDVYFLQHKETGARVETDLIGKRILEQLPATVARLAELLHDEIGFVSARLIRFYLRLFFHAGIVENAALPFCSGCKKGCATIQNRGIMLSQAPTVSVVIVSFNGEAFLPGLLQSLGRQTMPAVEIIIVDNASSDSSIDKIAQEYPFITLIHNPRNVHYAKAVNTGVAAASGQLVTILNQDLVLAEDFIERLVLRYLEEKNKDQVAAVVPQMRFNRLPSFINGIGNFITEKNWGSDNYFGVVDIGQFQHLHEVGSACFGALLVTKTAWAQIGGLDVRYKSFYEDVDWSFRTHVKGFKILAAPQALVYHAFGGSYPSGLKLTLVTKNRIRFVLKHLKGKIRWKFLKKYIKQDIKNILSFLRSKSYRNMYCYMKGYIKILGDIPNLIRHRFKARKIPVGLLEQFFVKGTPYVALANKDLNPVINKHVIRSYYYFTDYDHYHYPTDPIVY